MLSNVLKKRPLKTTLMKRLMCMKMEGSKIYHILILLNILAHKALTSLQGMKEAVISFGL